ncbi:MAG TPA: adenine phosphoribosyltransferase [Alteromonas australica]|uniref:Adenine phosphoribosyltransferase n=2 Tax=Alteromonas australica TaxID=589873 RepID=A0A075P0U6_9ALTE|nr:MULTISPECIES: adenine phosphoribosyltransferase [Alteromonas]MAO31466.1 adenine phosphoribosyltransferase [Alteromonas sp.]AIF99413.1 adenine phosphoribosyltransferase [Alteromonas australica]AJP44428.1 adenine phosphoribosyltransferase [Alteromonas australica]MBU32767.1 adenine phosphoribosyltransferase [Alteromonas sp.]QPL51313.1 adenine phosphoribosyltransferase [Alteromonas sp. B31-7]
MTAEYIKSVVKTVPDYPKPGILFRDVTSVLEDHKAFSSCISLLLEKYQGMGFNKVAGTEARGFLFGAPLAIEMGIGFVPVRKPNKLPREVVSECYELEYGTDTLEIHKDAIQPGDKVLLIDDLLATGGTIAASAKLIRRLGGEVEHAGFIINLPDLGGREKLDQIGVESFSLCEFEGE